MILRPSSGNSDTATVKGRRLLVDVAWHGQRPPTPPGAVLASAYRLAHRNEIVAPLVRAYPDQLGPALSDLDRVVGEYRANLAEACRRLDAAEIRPVLIKALPTEEFTYSNFDLVVGDADFERAIETLRPWVRRSSVYPLERRTKVLLYPSVGPAVHLHREVAWFDIPAIPTSELRAAAERPDGSPCDLPAPTMAMVILFAHAAFQNLALTLGELVTYRTLLRDADLPAAARAAERGGWAHGFRDAHRVAQGAVHALDEDRHVSLPAPLPTASSFVAGLRHATHLARTGRVGVALREALLRGPLVIAKRRRREGR